MAFNAPSPRIGAVVNEPLGKHLVAAHDAGGLWALVKALSTNESWRILVDGLGILGIGHGVKKFAVKTP